MTAPLIIRVDGTSGAGRAAGPPIFAMFDIGCPTSFLELPTALRIMDIPVSKQENSYSRAKTDSFFLIGF